MVDEGDEEDAIKPLPWYPDNFAWHSNFSRMQLRKNQALK
ncbi:tRNA (cytosine(34)-C(5))-methyltransferase-like protein, partial [Trifolium medium]|nr:tRNA (cytosine(34)-C(5))-methyltransferase-like protein [Trifolium medium]